MPKGDGDMASRHCSRLFRGNESSLCSEQAAPVVAAGSGCTLPTRERQRPSNAGTQPVVILPTRPVV